MFHPAHSAFSSLLQDAASKCNYRAEIDGVECRAVRGGNVPKRPTEFCLGQTRNATRKHVTRPPRIGVERLSFGNWLKAPTPRERRRAERLNA